MVIIKSKSEIEKMKEAGRITYETLKEVSKAVKPGVTTMELDKIAEDYIRSRGCTGSFKGYGGFPGTGSGRRYRAASDPAGSGAAESAERRAGPCHRG